MAVVDIPAGGRLVGASDRLTPTFVQEAEDPCSAYARYIQQTLGVPWPTVKDMAILRKKCKEFFEHYPQADWRTLCKVVQWAKEHRKRFTRVWGVVGCFRNAWTAGCLPELDVPESDPHLEMEISRALEGEERDSWRRRLLGAQGYEARREALEEWKLQRSE